MHFEQLLLSSVSRFVGGMASFVSNQVVAHRERLTGAMASVLNSLELDAVHCILFRVVELGDRLPRASSQTSGTSHSMFMVSENDWSAGQS